MGRMCCVKGCRTRSHDGRGNKVDHVARFFRFPTWKRTHGPQTEQITKRRRMAWIAAVRRKDITFAEIGPCKYVCSRHFHKGQPAYEMMETDPDWAPSLHLGYNDTTYTNAHSAHTAKQSKILEELRKGALQPVEMRTNQGGKSDDLEETRQAGQCAHVDMDEWTHKADKISQVETHVWTRNAGESVQVDTEKVRMQVEESDHVDTEEEWTHEAGNICEVDPEEEWTHKAADICEVDPKEEWTHKAGDIREVDPEEWKTHKAGGSGQANAEWKHDTSHELSLTECNLCVLRSAEVHRLMEENRELRRELEEYKKYVHYLQ